MTPYSPIEKKPPRKLNWQLILKLILGIGLIGLIFYFVDFREVGRIVTHANPWYLLALFVLFYFDRGLMAYKWDMLLQTVNIKIPFAHLFQIYVIVPLSGTVLPSTIGGDIFRLFSISRYKINNKAVLASMVMERFVALICTLILASIGLSLALYLMGDSGYFNGIGWLLALGVGLIIAFPLIIWIISTQDLEKIVGRLEEIPFIGKIAGKLHQVYLLCYDYKNHPQTLIKVTGWTLLEQTVPIVENLLMIYALNINVSLTSLIIIVPIIALAVRLPISLDGLGVQEGLYVALFGLAGVSASEAFLLSTISRIYPMLAALPWGVHYIVVDRRKILSDNQSPL